MRLCRLPGNPIITPHMSGGEHLHGNINGPSLIRVPDWLSGALGKYYLYFAHHQGQSIRLAYCDDLSGPWRIYQPGTLQLSHTPFTKHIASPDVHVDNENRRIVMYYHGLGGSAPAVPWNQYTYAAVSSDGLNFESQTEVLCQSYLRAFRWRGQWLGLAMPGEFYKSHNGLSGFQSIADLRDDFCFPYTNKSEARKARHFAVRLKADGLQVFFSRVADSPERILMSEVTLNDEPQSWRATPPVTVLRPEHDWEGAGCPLEPSRAGAEHQRVNQLRDPAVFEEESRTYLLYSIAGESGIAIAEIVD